MASAHLDTLSTRHARLDAQIMTETARPQPDSMLLAKLKRAKLRLKEELARPH